MKLCRAYAKRLVVANWKGIIFHCFDLDRHVTGLEGENGAGKTTVMAAYVTAILPNQHLLVFKNINGGAPGTRGDAGLWGRLGEEGISYSLIEWVSPSGKILWAGVAMTRGTMPSLDIKPFVIQNLPPNASPYDVLLLREEGRSIVPSLVRLREHVAMHGGRLVIQKTVADYMKVLFDHGITPMPMTTYDEQERFYRVLSTSMEGSALASLIKTGLRDYLLAPDVSLERRVVLMRESLEECRLTKRELERAQSAHAEISALFDAAWKMSSYAYFGARGRYEQETRNWRDQVAATRAARAQHSAQKATVERLHRLQDELTQLVAAALTNAASKQHELTNKENARSIRVELERVAKHENEFKWAADQAMVRRDEARAAEDWAGQALVQAQDECTRIADELGNAQKAVESLMRRVTELHVARELFADAQKAMQPGQIDRHNAMTVKQRLDRQYDEQTRAQTEVQAKFDAIKGHHVRFEALLERLRAITHAQHSAPPTATSAYEQALALETRLRGYGVEAERIGSLERELAHARDTATQQQRVRGLAAELGIDGSRALSDALAEIHAQLERLEAEQAAQAGDITERQNRLVEAQGRLPALREVVRRYGEARACRDQLAVLNPEWAALTAMESLSDTVEGGRGELANIGDSRRVLESRLHAIADRIRCLQHNAGVLDARLGAVAEHVDGRLLASEFDELPVQEAASAQARLGMWTEAIVVPVPEHAARQAADLGDRPDTLLFVSEQILYDAQEATTLEDSELVLECVNGNEAARLTRRPARPMLGRRAREAEVERLRGEREEMESDLVQLRDNFRVLRESLNVADRLLALGPAVWSADPQPLLSAEQSHVRALENSVSGLQKELACRREEMAAAVRKRSRLAPLETHRGLLDPPDVVQEVLRLGRQLEAANVARTWIETHGGTARQILDGLPILAVVPDATHRAQLEQELERLSASRGRLSHQRDALAKLLSVIEHLDRDEDEKNYYEKTSVIAGLQSKIAPAKAWVEETGRQLKTLRDRHDGARQAFSEAGARLNQIEERCKALKSDLARSGLQGTEEEVALARRAYESAKVAAGELGVQFEHTKESHLRETFQLEGLVKKVQEQKNLSSQQLSTLRFERRAQRDLNLVVAQLGLRGRIDSELNRQQHFPTGSLITAFQSSQTFQMLLLERLNAWPDVLADLKRIDGFSEPAAERRAIQTLRAWERVRLHIEHRIPRNLATADDPQIALAQMTEKMGELQRTLEAQENDMRSRSSGLANGITARQRSAKSLVVRLNRELEQVSFGSIRGLQIMLSFPEDMAKMLSCLRQENSLSLFDSHLPLEETLARLYQRETGGTIQGTRLFDYRNYLRMRLEVRRINGKWEATSDVSTGEAIGTGAAVLVMILRTWNEEAHRISGSAGYAIQQILLDEANRLDEKALDTLSEFCHRMDVQALVAAPGLEKPRRSTVFQLSRSMRGKDEFVTIRGTRITE